MADVIYYSKNFPRSELIRTDEPFDNTPSPQAESKLFYNTTFNLQPTRDVWGRLDVSSGYRSDAVNKGVGGSAISQHLFGEAADFKPYTADIEEVFDWMVNNLIFGQCILETRKNKEGKTVRLIHVSLPRLRKPNQQALVSPVYGEYLIYDKEGV